MEEIGKVAVIAVVAAICAVVVRRSAAEIGMVLALAAGVIILSLSMAAVGSVRDIMDMLAETAGISPAVIAPVIKTVGIGILTRIAAEVCRDAQEGGIAACVEVAGSAFALLVALPLLRAVLDTIIGLL